MDPIFDRSGHATGWLEGAVVHDLSGTPVAFLIRINDLYSHSGHHLGWFHSGFFRDDLGNAVAFMSGASDGPLLPILVPPPLPPLPASPLPPLPPPPSRAPLFTPLWSTVDWETFLTD